jgi:hypothetical protein
VAKKADESYNYAQDKDFAEQFGKRQLDEWNQLRAGRTVREQGWQESYNAWSLGAEENEDVSGRRNYFGRANLVLPQIRKEVETMTRRLVKAMFPEDYLKADPTLIANQDLAVLNTQVLRHFYDDVIGLQVKLMPWMKQNVLYGFSPIRQYWKKETNELFYKKRIFKEDKNGNLIPDFKRVREEVTSYDAPYICVADAFNTWISPVTATDASEIKKTFFRTKITYEELQKKFEEGTSIDPAFLKDQGKDKDEQFEEMQQRLAAMGETGVIVADKGQEIFDILEVWGRAEIDGRIIPFVCEIINEKHVIRIHRNPHWHQQAPFDFARFILEPSNGFYGRGLPEAVLSLQAQTNDTLNQGMDSTTIALNQIAIINPAFAPNSESFEFEAGARWYADPNGVKFVAPPDLSDIYIKNVSVLRNWITEMSDNQPQLPDPISGKARSTGQAQLAINEWQTDLYSFVNQIIKEALEPMTRKVHVSLQQNLPDDAIFRIAGKYAGQWVNRVVTPSDIVGNFYFKWLGAIQIENQSVKTQQMLNFLKVYPMLPPEERVKIKINWENIFIKLLRDGFQIKDYYNIISSENLNASVDPYIENKILNQGGDVETSPADPDEIHIQSHEQEKADQKDPYIRALFEKHIIKHKQQIDKKKAEMIAQQQMMAAQQAQLIQQGTTHPGRKPNDMNAQPVVGGPNPNGNQAQMSESTNSADLERGLR